MKIKSALLVFTAALTAFVACQKPTPDPEPRIELDQTELSFSSNGGTQTVSFFSTRSWAFKNAPDWVVIEPSRGDASDKSQTVSVSVLENTDKNRECQITLSGGIVKDYLTIKQEGPGGEIVPGDGSKENPFSATEARAEAAKLDSGEESAQAYYIHGFVKSFNSSKHEDGIKNFGNALFYITDDNSLSGDDFYCYQVYYLGGKKFTSTEQIKIGDEVIVYGKITNYNGTYETVGKGAAYIYMLNGKTEGGDEPGPGPDVDENTVYFNDFDKTAAQKDGNYWPYIYQTECWHNEQGSGISNLKYITEGNKASIRNNSSSTGSGVNNLFFGSAPAFFCVKNISLPTASNYTLSCLAIRSVYNAAPGASVFDHSQFKLYISADGSKWVELGYQFENGDPDASWGLLQSSFTLPAGTKTLCIGIPSPKEASTYRVDDLKLEISTGSGTSIDFSKGIEISDFGGGGGDTPSGVVDATVSQVLSEQKTDVTYRLTGTVSGFNSQYCSFDITDATGKIYVYSVTADTKAEYASKLQNGDTVTIEGQYSYYSQKSQHEIINAKITAWTSAGGGGGQGGDDPEIPDPSTLTKITCAEFNALPESDDNWYILEGEVVSIVNTEYGNLYIKDASGEMAYIYGVRTASGEAKKFSTLGVETGDVLKVFGPHTIYGDNKVVEMNNSVYISHTKGQHQEIASVVTLTFPDDNKENNKVNGYDNPWVAKSGSYSFNMVQFNNYQWNNWTYIRCGRKAASVASITSEQALAKSVSKVIVTFGTYDASYVNSAKLYVASDANFTSGLQTINVQPALGDTEFIIPSPAANLYYKLEIDCKAHTKNGFIQINKIIYAEAQ